MSTSRRFPYSDAMIKKCVIAPNPQLFDFICTRRDEDITPYEMDSGGHIAKPQFTLPSGISFPMGFLFYIFSTLFTLMYIANGLFDACAFFTRYVCV